MCFGVFVLTTHGFPAVSVFRGSAGPGSHDEHVDPAERHSPGDCNQERALSAAQTGPVPDHSDAQRPPVGQTATRASYFQYLLYLFTVCVHLHGLFQDLNPEVFIFENNRLLYSFLWHIPLTYRTDTSGTIHRHLMTAPTGNCCAVLLLHLCIVQLPLIIIIIILSVLLLVCFRQHIYWSSGGLGQSER